MIRAVGSVLGFRGMAAGAAFLANVLVARQLGPARYSQFAILFSIMTVVTGLSGPALDASLVRFAARYILPDRDDSAVYFKLVFYVKCCIGVLILIAGVLLAKPLLHLLFERDSAVARVPAYAVVLAFFGGAVMTMWGLAQSYYQSHQRFAKYAGFELMNSVLRVVLVLILLLVHVNSAIIMLCAYVAAPLVVAHVAWLLLPRGLLRVRVTPGVGIEFVHFAKWVVLAGLFTTVAQRLDILLLGYFKVPEVQVGYYGAAVVLALLGDLVVLTLFHVMLPKASQIRTAVEMMEFLRQFRWPSILAGLAAAPIIVFAGLVVRMTFGQAYAETGRLFAILFAGALASLACTPPVTAVYALGRSHLIAVLEGIRLAASFAIGVWVVPRFGVLGMAWTVSLVRGTIGAVTYVVAYWELRRIRRLERTAPGA